ncbi:hypothetical protein [Camelimonas lactis]|uniref:Uncharacterized protein n=1 Tax=Camelimonas lactis TaxID=659006 RepID=A0A4R2GUE2_9HYPH|nr:hypothetical protein [Camelimonas lactis]TCO14067.1 hypothetical protein EV666_10417 [Camelimonas lactis]
MNLFITTPLFSVSIVRMSKEHRPDWGMEFRGRSAFAYLGRVEIVASAERRRDFGIQW